MEKRVPNLYLENAEILPGGFRNFAGRRTTYNKEGNRNFTIVLTDDSVMFYAIEENFKKRYERIGVQTLIDDGWNVRPMKPRDEDEPDAPPRYKLNVTVSYPRPDIKGIKPPEVKLYSGKKCTNLSERTIDALDYAEYRTADLTIRPRLWTVDGTGERRVKAYLREMRVAVLPDRWADKYRDYDAEEETDDGEELPF